MEPTQAHPQLERLLTHQDWLRSLARKLVGDSQTAEDLVQETWMAAMKSPPDPDRPARPWLAGVVRRLASMRARGEGRRARRQNAVAVSDELPSTADMVEEVDTQRRLVGEVLHLSEPYRTTVMLRYFNNLSSAEIARHQNVPAGTVRWRLKRGLDELRERLDDSFGSRENWSIALLPLAKFGMGTGVGGAGTAGSITSWVASLGAAQWAAGLLAMLGVVVAAALVTGQWDRVIAADNRADLDSLEPLQQETGNQVTERVAVQPIERDPLAPAERRVRFLEPNHMPIEGLKVVLDDGSEHPPVAVTNALGELEFTTALVKGTLYARRSNSFVQSVEVVFTAAQVDLFLPWQARLTGRVLAGQGEQSGSLALGGLPLRLDSDVQLWSKEVNPAVIASFANPNSVRVITAEDGSFEMQNLPQDWSGKLWLPGEVAVQGASRRDESGRYVYFSTPERDAMVLVDRMPVLQGRIVGLDGKAVGEVEVLAWVDGAQTPAQGLTEADGRFALQLDSNGQAGLRLEAVTVDGLAQVQKQLDGQSVPEDFDLGDLVLRNAGRVAFRAVDAKDEPIRNAEGWQAGRMLKGKPSDSMGWGEAILPPGTSSGWVVAKGLKPAKISMQGTYEEQQVVMTPDAVLDLHIMDWNNLSMSGASLNIWSEGKVFAFGATHEPASWNAELAIGTFKGVLRSDADGTTQAQFLADDRGRVRMVGPVEGAPLWVEIVDPLGQPLHQHRIAALGVAEQRVERISVPQILREFHAQVRDASDNQLVGVNVQLQGPEGQLVQSESDLQGYVHFNDLAGDRYRLRIEKRGFVSQTVAEYNLFEGVGSRADEPVVFVMNRGHDVAVLVVDGEDQPISGGVVSARHVSDGELYGATPKGAPDQTLQDLDQGNVQITLLLGGVEYHKSLQAPLAQAVEFRVPAHGQAEVVWTLPETLDADVPLRVLAVALDHQGAPLEGRKPVEEIIGNRTGISGLTTFTALLPGRYAFHLQSPVDAQSHPVESSEHPAGDARDPLPWKDLTETLQGEVELGSPMRLSLSAQ